MATQADVRRIALSLPGTEEVPNHFAFSVRNKGKLKGFEAETAPVMHMSLAERPEITEEYMNDPSLRPAAHRDFWRHLIRQGSWAALLVVVSLAGGTLGFHVFSRQLWVDAFLNASMLLGGMGPVGDLGPTAGKLFAAGYALYAGLMFLVIAGLLVTPVFHRVLHRFHVEGK